MLKHFATLTAVLAWASFSAPEVRADFRTPRDMRGVKRAAEQLNHDAARLGAAAQRERRLFVGQDQHAIGHILAFNRQAHRFNLEIRRHYRRPERTERHFRALYNSFERVREAFPLHHVTVHVEEHMRHVSHSMRDLKRLYGYGYELDGRGVSVKAVAHRIQEAAAHVYLRARESSASGAHHHGGNDQRRAVDRLEDFSKAAAHFHRQIERHLQNPYETLDDFRELIERFERAEKRIGHFDHYVQEDFARIGAMIERLEHLSRDIYAVHHGDSHHRDRGHGLRVEMHHSDRQYAVWRVSSSRWFR